MFDALENSKYFTAFKDLTREFERQKLQELRNTDKRKRKQNTISYEDVNKLFDSFRSKKRSLKGYLQEYNDSQSNERKVSLSTFRRFVKKKLIATFIKPKLRSANVSKESSLVKRRSF